jgi:hypothetical protein
MTVSENDYSLTLSLSSGFHQIEIFTANKLRSFVADSTTLRDLTISTGQNRCPTYPIVRQLSIRRPAGCRAVIPGSGGNRALLVRG